MIALAPADVAARLQCSEEMLTSADVARELERSTYTALEYMHQMPHVRGPRGLLQVTRSDFEQWRSARDHDRAARVEKASRHAAGKTAARARRLSPVIYFVQDSDGYIKIGRCTDIVVRLAMIQNAHARPVTLLATTPGGAEKERSIHLRFAEYRIRGEWFVSSDDLRTLIAGLK